MPVRHGIEVSVITPDGNVLTEYATQNMGRAAFKSKFVSTRIQAIAGQTFYVKVKPMRPFPHDEDNRGDKLLGPISSNYGQNSTTGDRYDLRPRTAPAFDAKQPIEEPTATNLVVPRKQQQQVPDTTSRDPPFDLSAFIYIDGHVKPECRQIIWLDPNDSRYRRDGIILKGRWVQGDGERNSVGVRNWVFTSVGIDVLLARMNMQNDDDARQTTDVAREVEELTDAMAQNQMQSEQRSKPGQIEVHLKRIYTTGVSQSQGFRAYHCAGSNEVADAAKIGAEVTHTMTLQESQQRNMRLNTVAWQPYKKHEEIYAKFVFMYMGREKLVKMGLCNEDGTPSLQGRVHAAEHERPAKTRKRDDVEDSDEDAKQLNKLQRTPLGGEFEEAVETGAGQRKAKIQANINLRSSLGTGRKISEKKKAMGSEDQQEEL